MNSCEAHEIELSSLLDGEAEPAAAAAAVEHALACSACGAFFRAARRLAGSATALAADGETLAPSRAESLWLEIHRRTDALPGAAGERRPWAGWRRGWRAAALVTVGLGGGYLLSTLGAAAELNPAAGSGTLIRTAAGDATAMDERRFVTLADELMRAEPRYQRAMLEILRLVPALETGEGFDVDERRPFVRASRHDDGPRQGVL